jgi:hypothetical protein
MMKPSPKGEVDVEWLPPARRYRELGDERYPMRRYGLAYSSFTAWITEKRSIGAKLPTQVWITSLCSYWVNSIAQMCREVRHALPDAKIVLIGQLPRLMPDLAAGTCVADFLVTKPFSLEDQISDFSAYGSESPPFFAVRLNPKIALQEIRAAVTARVMQFTFFEDNVTNDGGEALAEIVTKAREFHRHVRFHIICGLCPTKLTPQLAKLFADPKLFSAIHFEQADRSGELDVDSYLRARELMTKAGAKFPDSRLSGFVWIGRPDDDLEQVIMRAFHVLDLCGNLILKPFTPCPGSSDHLSNANYLDAIPHYNWSPHFFPFSEFNKITRSEYHDLYRLSAFLNEKVRSRSFDFLKDTLGPGFLRESLKKEVWKIEPSPLRIINQPTAV